jgi:nucleotide-binding universal stress UspA family protein
MNYNKILLASHGTPGACAAEVAALNLCRSQLHHLIVIPDFWKGMMGDDWLNNAVTQSDYGDYLEGELKQEVDANIQRVTAAAAERNLNYNYELLQGKPTECLLKVANSNEFDLIVIGSTRPKSQTGLNSRIDCKELLANLNTPLLIIPYPHV